MKQPFFRSRLGGASKHDRTRPPRWGSRRILSFGLTGTGLLALGIALGSEGCTVNTNGDGGGFVFDDGGIDSATVDFCNECLLQQCSAQWAVCRSTPDCLGIYQCATAPGCDQACVFDCYTSRPNGQATYYALSACDCTGLLGPCGGQCPGVPISGCLSPTEDGGAIPDAASAYDAGVVQDCATCTDQLCGQQKANCGPGTPCEAYTQCLSGCLDAPCVDQCAATYAAGYVDSQSLSRCVLDSCRIACGF